MNTKDILEKSEEFQFFKKYYQREDFASRYGISRMEIRHSNFLAWLLNSQKSHQLNEVPIKILLNALLENKYPFNNTIKQILKIRKYELSDISVYREKMNIDIFIKFKLNEIPVCIIIENKIKAIFGKEQPKKYIDEVKKSDEFKEIICLYLHPIFNDETDEAKKHNFHSITYQWLYEQVLLPILEKIEENEDEKTKYVLEDYFHCLSTPSGDDYGIIITKKEKVKLDNFVKENKSELLSFFRDLGNNKEYEKFFLDNRNLFLNIINKYINLEEKDKNIDLEKLMKKALSSKIYSIKGIKCKSISEFVKKILLYFRDNREEDLEKLVNISGEDKLMVKEKEILKMPHPQWYKKEEKNKIEYKKDTYYILSSWYSWEYWELRDSIDKEFPDLDINGE